MNRPARKEYVALIGSSSPPSWLTGQLARQAQSLVSEALAERDVRRQHFVVLTALAE